MDKAELERLLDGGNLPEGLAAEVETRAAMYNHRIDTLARVLCNKRKAAVDYRRMSGIEDEWREAEDQYNGIDDANRYTTRELKPSTMSGALTSEVVGISAETRSTAYLNITRPYTDAASARIGDMLLPTDDRNWALKPTPIPSLQKLKKDFTPVGEGLVTNNPMPAMPGEEAPPPAAPGGEQAPPQPRPLTRADIALAMENKAAEQAQAAQKRIDDWLVECDYHAHMRRAIQDTARLGTGILCGPTPVRRRGKKVTVEHGEARIEMESRIAPQTRRVSVWDFYPAPDCGDNIHNGTYCLERDRLKGADLRSLKGLPGYSSGRIDQVLKEGPGKRFQDAEGPVDKQMEADSFGSDDLPFEVWYFYGDLDKADFKLLEADLDLADLAALLQMELEPQGAGTIPVIVTMVNDTPVRVAINPLDSGEYPYDMIVWQECDDKPWGHGIPYQGRTPQKMVVAATRNLMDNAGLAGGPILVINKGMIVPEDGCWSIQPRKVFLTTEETTAGVDVRTGIMSIDIPIRQAELLAIAQFGLKMMEDVTGLPMLLQGQLGKAPDTVGGMQMLQNNASSVVRRLAKMFDDRLTEPHISRYYEWLMLYGPEASEKGDFQIEARGSSALVERDIQNQTIMALPQMALNPAFNLSPARSMEEFLRSQKLDPARFQPTEAERKAAAAQQPPPPPQVMVAQIREQGAMQREQMRSQVEMAGLQGERDRDTIYVQAETQRTQAEHEARQEELAMKLQLAQLDYAAKHQMTLEDVRAKLTMKSAEINLQRELAHTPPTGAPQVSKPPTEPAGRAPNGEAYER